MTYEEINEQKVQAITKGIKVGFGLAALGGVTYLGYRVYKTYKRVKAEARENEQIEEERLAKKVHDEVEEQIASDFNFDHDLGDEEEQDDIVDTEISNDNVIDMPTKNSDYNVDLFPMDIDISNGTEGIRFETREDLKIMRFGVETPEAMKQYKAYVLAEVVQQRNNSMYPFLMTMLDIEVDINMERDENLAMNIRENRETFFGEEAPESILGITTFGELIVLLAKKVQYDWGDNELIDIISGMIQNVNWIHLLAESEEAYEAVEKIMNNDYLESDLNDQQVVGLFGLPFSKFDRVVNDSHYGFIDQYNDSNFGE